jgi:hypothetical protein
VVAAEKKKRRWPLWESNRRKNAKQFPMHIRLIAATIRKPVRRLRRRLSLSVACLRLRLRLETIV